MSVTLDLQLACENAEGMPQAANFQRSLDAAILPF